jgi:hypothetical protein
VGEPLKRNVRHLKPKAPHATIKNHMPNTVFFAWQLDTPSDHNKSFIWRALGDAVRIASPTAHAELAPRPETDTQGVPGSPNIVETIFNRIRACSVFVADLSFVGSTSNGRLTPNPNGS